MDPLGRMDPFVPPNVYIGNVCTINISLIEVHCIHKKECSVGNGALGTTSVRYSPAIKGPTGFY